MLTSRCSSLGRTHDSACVRQCRRPRMAGLDPPLKWHSLILSLTATTMAASSSNNSSVAGGGDGYSGSRSSKSVKTKGKTAASLALFPIADETFEGILHKYPNAAMQLKDPSPLRKGKWSKEEEELAVTCISHFQDGLIPLSGVGDDTLRGLLSYMLHSDGMRVTKKFAGDLSIRKVSSENCCCSRPTRDVCQRSILGMQQSRLLRR